ncbi:spore germination protein GerW family protein [Micromonospora sp. NPDC049679]|uniref:GerW family sporulation protein n=1 Tax=Micromonospora sp. NPDC049679 TaxID=3155920 RepID=UPI00340D30F9
MSDEISPRRTAMDTIRDAVQGATARTVFGEPVTQGETTVIPVARVTARGGAGGGAGGTAATAAGTGTGSGAGFSLSAEPAGVFVVTGDKVDWRPALDLNKVILGGQLIGIAALLTVRAMIKARRS